MTPNSSTDSATRDGLEEAATSAKVLVRQLNQAAWNSGNADAEDSWKRQERTAAAQDKLLNETLAAVDTLLAASRAEVEKLRAEVKELAWHRDPWISALDQVPPGREPVAVIAQGWDKPKVLSYEIQLLKDVRWERFIDNDTGLWYWYPERMHWMHLPDYSDLCAALSTKKD